MHFRERHLSACLGAGGVGPAAAGLTPARPRLPTPPDDGHVRHTQRPVVENKATLLHKGHGSGFFGRVIQLQERVVQVRVKRLAHGIDWDDPVPFKDLSGPARPSRRHAVRSR